ncbi:MAG: NAD(P)H-dependent oxidoreductase [Actinomycetota bacterium]|nr:NAD(P)H-dependent oxidoreductase [Actinomycetota bacterium]
MARQILDSFADQGVEGDLIRLVDHNISPGVEPTWVTAMSGRRSGHGVLDSDILILSTPTWMGHMSSVACRALERLDAELSETDEQGRGSTSGKVAVVAVVGNEDGAHKIIADCFQALNDVGFTVAGNGSVYWNANIDNPSDYEDLGEITDAVASMVSKATAQSTHLVRLLREENYPLS